MDLEKVDKTTLPENLRSLPMSEIQKYVESMQQKREEIKAEIAELSKKRADYLAKNLPQSGQQKTLDNLMINALYKQLKAKGFQVNN